MHSLGAHGAPMPKPHFKAPEGRYELVGERLGGLCNFNAARMPRLSLAQLSGGDEAGTYLLFSVGDALHVCRYAETAKVGGASSQPPTAPASWPMKVLCYFRGLLRSACLRGVWALTNRCLYSRRSSRCARLASAWARAPAQPSCPPATTLSLPWTALTCWSACPPATVRPPRAPLPLLAPKQLPPPINRARGRADLREGRRTLIPCPKSGAHCLSVHESVHVECSITCRHMQACYFTHLGDHTLGTQPGSGPLFELTQKNPPMNAM